MIPEYKVFGISGHFYLYILVLIGFALILTFTGVCIVKKRPIKSDFISKVFLHFLLSFWLVACVPWFVVQAHWLKKDIADFAGKPLSDRQSKAVSRVISSYGLSNEWQGFYNFLEFARRQIPAGAGIYVLPTDPIFQIWTTYWFYPELRPVDSSEKADYILSFNVDLPEQVPGFEKLKQFAPNKLILKRVNKLINQ